MTGPSALICPGAARSWGVLGAPRVPACGTAGSGSGQGWSCWGLGVQPPMSPCPTALLPHRLLQSVGPGLHSGLAGVKVLLLNVSRAVAHDVLITFSPTEVRCSPLPCSESSMPSKHPFTPVPGLGVPWRALLPTCSTVTLWTHVNFTIPWCLGGKSPPSGAVPAAGGGVRWSRRRNLWDLHLLPTLRLSLDVPGDPA